MGEKLSLKKELEKQEEKRLAEIKSARTPRRDQLEMFGLVIQLHGTDQIKVLAEDGIERMCRIPGKMRKSVWIRQRDIVIIKLWDFQRSKADIVWRYTGNQSEHLKRRGLLDKLPL